MPSQGTILVTGASSFIGAHVLELFLAEGTKIRGVVRSQASADRVLKVNQKYASLLEFAIVPDITKPDAFDEAVRGVDGVIHMASPFRLEVENNERDLLVPAIEGTSNVLESIHKHAPQVKRVVITSSFAALVDLSKGLRPGHVYTEKDWNPATFEESKTESIGRKAGMGLCQGEEAQLYALDHASPVVYGPNHHYIDDLSNLNESSGMFYSLMNGSRKDVPPTGFWAIADVRDVALAHKLAYETPSAAGQRYFTTAGLFSFQQICDILREEFPEELRGRVPVGRPGEPIAGVYDVNNGKARRELGMEFIPLREIVVDTARNLLALERKLGKA
ncbi:Putative uncharacterized oxidoreductase [Cladobotryum mycophilum]|uniref:Uncharacterized oxidoreductase n=1 Tax=Cladobotryum mycophilum TaxID=491253 RepID=A0ABR0SLA6_9HYPO